MSDMFAEAGRILERKRLQESGNYHSLLEHNLQRIQELQQQGDSKYALADAILNFHEDAGVRNGVTFPVKLPEMGDREVKYSRLLFQFEIQLHTETPGTLPDGQPCAQVATGKKRDELIKTLARKRGVTSQIAFQWHIEEMEFLLRDKGVNPDEVDFAAHYFSIQDLHDLEAVMFMED